MKPSNQNPAQAAGDVESYQSFAERLDHWVEINRGKWVKPTTRRRRFRRVVDSLRCRSQSGDCWKVRSSKAL